MKYFRTIFLIAVLSIGVYLTFGQKRAAPLTEKYIFRSEAFSTYFKAQGYPIIEDPMLLNRNYIDIMRKHQDPDAIQKMFTGADLTKSYQNYLFELVPPYKEGDYFTYLKNVLSSLRQNPRFKKSKTTFSDDSYTEGNLPFLQFTLPNQIQVIRMGLPIIETPYLQNLIFTPSVNPEFMAFIRQQKRHLYVNLMKRDGLEGPNSFAIESLERTEPSFVAVTLDKNSDFYWQQGNFPSESEAFKREYYSQLVNPKGAYYFSQALKHWDLELKSILDKTHQKYFNQKLELSAKERQDFIELSYLEILDRLVALLNPNSMNITCKHAIDRGPSLAVLWQLKLGYADENEAVALLLAPPLLMHNRTSHESRLDRFTTAASFFYQKKEGVDRIQL